MALAHYGVKIAENELLKTIRRDYPDNFSNIWNPTIARLACRYGIDTTFSAAWPLLKPHVFPAALHAYQQNPEGFDIHHFENKNDNDGLPEPLSIAYQDIFAAGTLGCAMRYGKLTARRLHGLVAHGSLVQTSVKLHLLYPGKKHVFHSVLIFDANNTSVTYHDPTYGKSLSCRTAHLIRALTDVGAFLTYRGIRKKDQ